MLIDPADAVHLNIGGQRFTTSRAVLRRGAPDFFDSITDVDPESSQRDRSDASSQPIEVLIDRDPRHFHTVLAFLRKGRCTLPDTVQGLVELRYEAEAYQVPLPTWYVSGPTTSACGAVQVGSIARQANWQLFMLATDCLARCSSWCIRLMSHSPCGSTVGYRMRQRPESCCRCAMATSSCRLPATAS
jgi:BTB/POZ domain